MEFSVKLHALKAGWSIGIYYEVTDYNRIYNIVFLSLKISFVLANSADPNEMPHNAAFHLGHQCLPKYRLRGFRSAKGLSKAKKILNCFSGQFFKTDVAGWVFILIFIQHKKMWEPFFRNSKDFILKVVL